MVHVWRRNFYTKSQKTAKTGALRRRNALAHTLPNMQNEGDDREATKTPAESSNKFGHTL